MANEYVTIALHLTAAWIAGSVIGLERSFHGRPAGFRTHALVCLASAVLMLVTTHQWEWIGTAPIEAVRTDPTRLAQGIMTGIGFLGAGVIFKEGLSVRGLTTAASIWMTAALGILYGVGFFYPAILATLATLGTLALFRYLEDAIPSHVFAQAMLRFAPEQVMSDADLRALLKQHGFSVANVSYRLDRVDSFFEYRFVVRSLDRAAMLRLVERLRALDGLVEFRVSPTGD